MGGRVVWGQVCIVGDLRESMTGTLFVVAGGGVEKSTLQRVPRERRRKEYKATFMLQPTSKNIICTRTYLL